MKKRTRRIKEYNCWSIKTMLWKTCIKIYQKGHRKPYSTTETTICFIKYQPTFRETCNNEFYIIFFNLI